MNLETVHWPSAVESEESMLGSMMLNDGIVGECLSIVDDDDFHVPAHGLIFRAMKTLAAEGKPCEGSIVWDRMKALEPNTSAEPLLLYRLIEKSIVSMSAPHHATIVREKAALRRIMRASTSIFNAAMSQTEAADDVAANAHAAIFSASIKSSSRSAESAAVAVPKTLSAIAEAMEQPTGERGRGASFGIESIDNITGGLHPGQLSVLAGRPGDGKTVLATDIVRRNAKHGVGALVFSLEMSTDELNQRMLSPEARVLYGNIQNLNLTNAEFERIGAAASRMMEWPVEFDDASRLTAQEIYIRTRMAKSRNPSLGLVVVDSLGLMSHGDGRKNGLNHAQLIGRSVNTLREMAKDPGLGVAVLLVHHLNRSEDGNKRPSLRDLRDSGEIDQWAHNVYLLHRQGETDSSGYVSTLFIAAKQRHRRREEVEVSFDGAYQTFRDALFG